MVQPVQYGLKFVGPFLGLNTDQARHKIDPAFAVDAENVLITRTGSFRPREPLTSYIATTAENIKQKIPGLAVGMIHLDLQTLAGYSGDSEGPSVDVTAVLVKTIPPVALYQVTRGGHTYLPMSWETSDVPSLRMPTWVFANGWLYIIDGSSPLVKYNGAVTQTVGIELPTLSEDLELVPPYPVHVIVGEVADAGSIAIGDYEYAITFYDSVNDIESNPVYTGTITVDMTSRGILVRYTGSSGPGPYGGRGLTGEGAVGHMRVYRKNVTLNQPFYRLVHVFEDLSGSYQDWVDTTQIGGTEDEPLESITLSDTQTGPFAPNRNTPPPATSVAAWYKRRMWYADPDDGSILRYSELGKPEYVAGANFYEIGGDRDDVVTGMIEMAGQLVVLKKESIWIVSGEVARGSNESDALGNVPLEVNPEIYKTKSKTGCDATAGGNGAIVCGHPPLLYYPKAEGFYVFDGVDDRPVSDIVSNEWAALMAAIPTSSVGDRAHNHSMCYALDVANQILLMVPGSLGTTRLADRVLCYHWGQRRPDGIGAWTRFRFKELGVGPEGPLLPVGVGCACTALGKRGEVGTGRIVAPAPYLVALIYQEGTLYTRVFVADVAPEVLTGVPDWKWQTGDLPIMGGKRGHVYWWEVEHDRYRGEGTAPTLVTEYNVDGGEFLKVPVTAVHGTDVTSMLTRRRLGRTARTMGLRFSRGILSPPWDSWEGITGFALDVELAEQR